MKLLRISLVLVLLLFFLQVAGCNNNDAEFNGKSISTKNEKTIVSENGILHTNGNRIVNKDGKAIALHGMSLFWSQWGGKYYNANCIGWLKDKWNCNIVRAAMGIDGGGYLENQSIEKEKVFTVINACIENGIYVIIDWHDHQAEKHVRQAKEFFGEIAQKYSGNPNIIYEIYNEPLQISWSDVVKPYAIEVINEIRKYDKENLIVVGTPNWSQFVDDAASDPIDDKNVAYSLHYYTSTHTQWLRDRASKALAMGATLFVTEFGISEADGNGKIDYVETEKWNEFADSNNLSWCNWSVIDKDETSAALLTGANSTGNWTDDQISESGKYIKNLITKKNSQ